MVRIGRQIPHFREVDPVSIRAVFSDDRRFRYLLSMQYGSSLYGTDRTKKAAVILKNPSAADERAADSTIRKVETFIYRHLEDVRVLSILNIFGLRATDAADLNFEYRVNGAESVIGPWNDATIGEVTGESDYVVVAWGNRSGIDAGLYEDRVSDVKILLGRVEPGRIFEVRGAQEYRQPLHGMLWGYDHRLVPYLKRKEE